MCAASPVLPAKQLLSPSRLGTGRHGSSGQVSFTEPHLHRYPPRCYMSSRVLAPTGQRLPSYGARLSYVAHPSSHQCLDQAKCNGLLVSVHTPHTHTSTHTLKAHAHAHSAPPLSTRRAHSHTRARRPLSNHSGLVCGHPK